MDFGQGPRSAQHCSEELALRIRATRGRSTERQRDRETERQRGREAERQREGDRERERESQKDK